MAGIETSGSQSEPRNLPERRVRPAGLAGSWYTGRRDKLDKELSTNLDQVDDAIDGIDLPIPGARVIIAPHAGYRFSGPNAAWAYKSLDLSKAKRVFIIGPSHTYHIASAALGTFDEYQTPFGSFDVDTATISELKESGQFQNIPAYNEKKEHCLEMQLPYLWKRLEQTHGDDRTKWPTIVPIIIGSCERDVERHLASLLAPYVRDSENAFIVSSDFCHWGPQYRYEAFYSKGHGDGSPMLVHGIEYWKPRDGPIHESIKMLDDLSIDAIKTGIYDRFWDNLDETENTVCGRHPIGVMMAALSIVREDHDESDEGEPLGDKGKFKFIKYDRSEEVTSPYLASGETAYSVSYASAYATL